MLFNWWRARRQKKRTDIFWFYDGERRRGADPIRVLQELALHPEFNPQSTPGEARSPDQRVAAQASKICVAAVHQAFGAHEWRQDAKGRVSGLTAQESMDLLVSFDNWMEALKKNGDGLPITSPSTTAESCPTSCAMEGMRPLSGST